MLVFATDDCMEFINFIITYLVHTWHSCISSVDSVIVFLTIVSKALGKHFRIMDTLPIHIEISE